MQHVMLFGEGRNGEVYDIEDGCRKRRYIPDDTFPLGGILFTIDNFNSENGNTYLIGYHGKEPLISEVEDAIQRFKPTPI